MLMKVERDELLRAVALVAGVPNTKSDIPILTQLVLRCGDKGGTVRATDMELEITAPFAAETSQAGEICVGAKLLHNIVKRLPDGQAVSMTLKEQVLKIVCGRSRFELATLPAADYPPFSPQKTKGEVWKFEVEADLFGRMLGAVRHCESKDQTRFYLTGVYLHVTQAEPIRLIAVATNGHVLAKDSMLAPVGSYGMPGIIIPADTVSEFMKLLPDKGQLVTISVSDSFIWLDRSDGLSMGSKLIEGTYPDYERVIPKNHMHHFRCDADALATAVGRVATICDSDHAAVTLSIDPKGTLSVISQRTEIGIGRDRVENFEMEGIKQALTFNYKYLAAMLSSYAGGTIELRYNDDGDPTVITLAGSDAGVQVLMPMRGTVTEAALAEAA